MKIVVLDGYTENPGDLSWAGFERLGSLTVYDRTPYSEGVDEVVRRAQGAEAVLINKTPLDAATLARLAPTLRYVGVLATGYNVVDLVAAKALGVTCCNVPGYGTAAVAQFTFALILELCHRVGLHSDSVKRGDWHRSQDFCYWLTPQHELAGKTLGLIGYGNIGRAVGALGEAFGMRVLAASGHGRADGRARRAALPELLAESDVVSLHCPLTDATRHLINRDSLAHMKKGALLINTARGPLIDEAALWEALRSGHLSGAALDVLSDEPPGADHPLYRLPNCILTPHIAWAPQESRQRLMDIAVENLEKYLAGTPQNVVNP